MAEPGQAGDARAEVLARIRAALGNRPRPPGPPDAGRAGPGSSILDEAGPQNAGPGAQLVELFAQRVADYRATVRRVPADGLASGVAAALHARRATRVAVPADLPAAWCGGTGDPAGPQGAPAAVEWLTDPDVDVLDGCDGVLTGCALAIAETGTIVLDAGPRQGRRVLTLVPDYHLCVVRADQLVPDVPGALARLDPVRPLTFISGPSATSDIELSRVEGVHGPRTLDVLIVE